MATLWVYLPKYSTTVLGDEKGCLAQITQSLRITGVAMEEGICTPDARKAAMYFALQTLLIARVGNKYFPLLFVDFHVPLEPDLDSKKELQFLVTFLVETCV